MPTYYGLGTDEAHVFLTLCQVLEKIARHLSVVVSIWMQCVEWQTTQASASESKLCD